MQASVAIYGDSLMKGTIIDERLRYHATMEQRLSGLQKRFGLRFTNRARFGCTVERGLSTLERDIDEGLRPTYAVMEFGGNDCDFRWEEVSASPEQDHQPLTPLPRFREALRTMVEMLRRKGSIPILMTLPPIDAERYFTFLCGRGNDRSNLLHWLGDVQMIYRFHELYSATVAEIAHETSALLVDVRRIFLDKRRYRDLIGLDGIHLAPTGYAVVLQVYEAFIERLRAEKRANAQYGIPYCRQQAVQY